MIDTKKLKTDATYWDDVAPYGATHYCQRLGWLNHPCSKPDPCCITRPQSDWVYGLPPVGTICELNLYGYWFAATVLAYGKTKFLYEIAPGQIDNEGDLISGELKGVIAKAKFRHIHPPKAQRDRDDLVNIISHHPIYKNAINTLADAIIAAGWTKP